MLSNNTLSSSSFSLSSKNKTFCIDGDGSFLMHLGSIMTAGNFANKNFKYILLNNNTHDSVGGQSTNANNIDFDRLSTSLGFKKFYSDLVDSVAYVEIENRWDTYNNLIDISALSPCSYLWERIYVWHDGTCNPCDVDYKSQLTTGNANDLPLRNIWHSRSYENLRKDHQSGNRSEYNPCDRCGV